ncbi:MAG: hypothetical protein FJX76_06005 [Armatimonadetes bacterium]|nr:hypothetical protein [Armatimonadota bacterium]
MLRHRVLEVEITTNGMRVIDAADTRLIPWPEVYQLYVDRHQARFFHEGRPVVFERDWPGFRRVVDALIARAGLVSRPRKLALADLTGLASHSYERG